MFNALNTVLALGLLKTRKSLLFALLFAGLQFIALRWIRWFELGERWADRKKSIVLSFYPLDSLRSSIICIVLHLFRKALKEMKIGEGTLLNIK